MTPVPNPTVEDYPESDTDAHLRRTDNSQLEEMESEDTGRVAALSREVLQLQRTNRGLEPTMLECSKKYSEESALHAGSLDRLRRQVHQLETRKRFYEDSASELSRKLAESQASNATLTEENKEWREKVEGATKSYSETIQAFVKGKKGLESQLAASKLNETSYKETIAQLRKELTAAKTSEAPSPRGLRMGSLGALFGSGGRGR